MYSYGLTTAQVGIGAETKLVWYIAICVESYEGLIETTRSYLR